MTITPQLGFGQQDMYPEVLTFDDITVSASIPPEKKKFPWWILLFAVPFLWKKDKKRYYFKRKNRRK